MWKIIIHLFITEYMTEKESGDCPTFPVWDVPLGNQIVDER